MTAVECITAGPIAASGRARAAAIEIRGLQKSFGGLKAICDLSLSIAHRVVHSIIGPNGAGKTCVFNCIMGQYKPDSGEIALEGERIDGLEPNQIASAGVARTYQNIRLFRNMTAIENVMVGRYRCLRSGLLDTLFATRRFRSEERAAREKAADLLEFVEMAGRGDVLARNLSYGEQRRLEIARALATEPKAVLLDEPAAGMNPVESERLMELISRLRDEQGLTVVLIEHEMRVVMSISDRVSVLDRGQLLAEGSVHDIRQDQRVIEAYLGNGAAARQRTGRTRECR